MSDLLRGWTSSVTTRVSNLTNSIVGDGLTDEQRKANEEQAILQRLRAQKQKRIDSQKAAHEKIKAVLGKELRTAPPVNRGAQRQPRPVPPAEEEDSPRAAPPVNVQSGKGPAARVPRAPVNLLQYSSSEESSSDEEKDSLGINPDVPLNHPINRLHSSQAVSPMGVFHPLSSPPAPSQFPMAHKPSASGLIHPGLRGGPQAPGQFMFVKPLSTSNASSMQSTLSGTGNVTAGTFSSSAFISPTLHNRLAKHIASRPGAAAAAAAALAAFNDKYPGSPSSPPSVAGTPRTPETPKSDDAAAAHFNRSRARRPRSPIMRVTGTHQLNIIHQNNPIHSIRESNQLHMQEYAPRLIVPIIRAGWREHGQTEYLAVSKDANGTLRTTDGTVIDPSQLPDSARLSNDELLDPETRSFLVSYVQSHTHKTTEEDALAHERTLARRAQEVERQKEDQERLAQSLQKSTEDDERRRHETHLAQKEKAIAEAAAVQAGTVSLQSQFLDLPDLPELPPSFWELEATFHQAPTATKHDIRSFPGSLTTLVENQALELELDSDEHQYLRKNPRRWRRRSFSKGHSVSLAPGFKEIVPPEEAEEPEEEEFEPVEIVDHNIPDSALGSNFASILHQLNAPTGAAAAATTEKPSAPMASKPLAALSEDDRKAEEEAHAKALLQAEHDRLLAQADAEAASQSQVFEFGDDDEDEETTATEEKKEEAPTTDATGEGTASAEGGEAAAAEPAVKSKMDELSEEEREKKLQQFLSDREAEEAAAAAAADSTLTEAKRLAFEKQQSMQAKKKAEEEQILLQEYTRAVVLPNLENAIHKSRIQSDPNYAREVAEAEAREAWEKECEAIQTAFDSAERERLTNLFACQEELKSFQSVDEKESMEEDEKLDEAKTKFEDVSVKHASLVKRANTATNALAKASEYPALEHMLEEWGNAEAAEEAKWDEKLNTLEETAKDKHMELARLKGELANSMAAIAAAQQASGEQREPDAELVQSVATVEQDAEAALQEYEKVFDEKQDWLDLAETRKNKVLDTHAAYEKKKNDLEVAADPSKFGPALEALTDEVEQSKTVYTELLESIELAREQRDTKQDELEARIEELSQPLPEPEFPRPPEGLEERVKRESAQHSRKSSAQAPPPVEAAPVQPAAVMQQPQQQQQQQPPQQAAAPVTAAAPAPQTVAASASSKAPSPAKPTASAPAAVAASAASSANTAPTAASASVPAPAPAVAAAPSVDPTAVIKQFIAGSSFVLHLMQAPREGGGAPTPSSKKVVLWAEFNNYDYTTKSLVNLSQYASFYCCDAARTPRAKEQKLPFSIIDTLLPGKRTPVFLAPQNAALDEKKCFAFGGAKAMVSLEAQDEKTKVAWMDGIKFLLIESRSQTKRANDPNAGKATEAASSPAPAAASPAPVVEAAKPVVAPAAKVSTPPKPAAPAVFTSDLGPLLNVSEQYKSPKPLTDALSLLAHGLVVRLFSSGSKLINISDQLLYSDFAARPEPRLSSRCSNSSTNNPVLNASLYFCPPGQRAKISNQSLYLTDVIGVTEGKQGVAATLFEQAQSALTNPSSQILPASHCFTLHMADGSFLAFQSSSKQNRNLFLRGLYDIFDKQVDKLRADGKNVERVRINSQREADDDHLIRQPAPSASYQEEQKYPSPASSSAVPVQQPSTASTAAPEKSELLTLLFDVFSRGEEFTQYSLTPSNVITKRFIYVWVDFPDCTPGETEEIEDEIHSAAGAVVYWCDAIKARGGPQAPEEDKGIERYVEDAHYFPLDSIHSVVQGKAGRPELSSVADSKAFSFQSTHPPPRGAPAFILSLSNEQESLQQLWASGLKHLLQ